jgi:hypothetical protein
MACRELPRRNFQVEIVDQGIEKWMEERGGRLDAASILVIPTDVGLKSLITEV